MAQPRIPAARGAAASLQAQNGAASASGSPYTNGPVHNTLMSPQVSSSQGYDSQPPGSYPRPMPAKTLNPFSAQSNYGGSQGSGQTLNSPLVTSGPVLPSLHSGPVPRMPLPTSQNPAATPMPSGSFLPGANPPPPLNWQYNYPSTGPQTNHFPHVAPPTLPGNPNLTADHQYVSSGDPALQTSFKKPGSALPLQNPPLPPTFQPGAPPGPPPAGGPPPSRGPAPQKTPPRAAPPPSFNSAVNQEGITSNANNGSTAAHNTYDEIEGGGFLATPQLVNQNPKTSRSVGSAYPSLPPGYQNSAPPVAGMPPPSLSYPSGPQAFTQLVQDLLKTLPQMFTKTLETQSALGPALQAAFKLISPTGGRMSVFQTQLPTLGVGALKPREEPNQRSSAKEIHLTPSTDFYKKLALDCSGQQAAVDLFLLSGQYSDLASLGCISRYSAGSVYYYPSYHHQHNPVQVQKLQKELHRYLTRKIGFEAVMRIRCTKGLSIHTFHGNFFVRSTDLLSLPNVNPDAGYAVQMSVEESLTDTQLVSFQSALLYTSSKGERRIRVHTLCLPVVSTLNEVFLGADVQAISGLLANMAVDRSVTASLSDARDALVNAVIDSLSAYRSSVLSGQQPGLMVPFSLRLFPLFVLALLKQKSFQTGTSIRLDERIFAMCQVKSQPLVHLMLTTHPSLYRVDNLSDEGALNINDRTIPQPPILQLSVEKLSRDGAFLMDAGSLLMLWVGRNCSQNFLSQVLGVQNYASIPQTMTDLPELDTPESARIAAFISWLREQRPFFPVLYVIREESLMKAAFLQSLVEDRTESALSYYEFLLHIQQQVNK